MSKRKPNILLIISDQQRIDTLGFNQKTPCQTPYMDRIAREGDPKAIFWLKSVQAVSPTINWLSLEILDSASVQ